MFEGWLNFKTPFVFSRPTKGGVRLGERVCCALFAFAISSPSVRCSPPARTDGGHAVPLGGKAEAWRGEASFSGSDIKRQDGELSPVWWGGPHLLTGGRGGAPLRGRHGQCVPVSSGLSPCLPQDFPCGDGGVVWQQGLKHTWEPLPLRLLCLQFLFQTITNLVGLILPGSSHRLRWRSPAWFRDWIKLISRLGRMEAYTSFAFFYNFTLKWFKEQFWRKWFLKGFLKEGLVDIDQIKRTLRVHLLVIKVNQSATLEYWLKKGEGNKQKNNLKVENSVIIHARQILGNAF